MNDVCQEFGINVLQSFGLIYPYKNGEKNQDELFLGVSKNRGKTPQIIHFNKMFHYKSSILGYHYFWKHPYLEDHPI